MTQNESSITLQWVMVKNILTYSVQYEGHGFNESKNVNASSGDPSVEVVVSNLTAAREYTFTVFTVFEGASSFGYTFSAVTGR